MSRGLYPKPRNCELPDVQTQFTVLDHKPAYIDLEHRQFSIQSAGYKVFQARALGVKVFGLQACGLGVRHVGYSLNSASGKVSGLGSSGRP